MKMATNLTPENIRLIIMNCLLENEKDLNEGDELIVAEGISLKFGFVKQRIEDNKPKIAAMLSQLPDEFQEKSGGGMSFLNGCVNKKGVQWTGHHPTVEELFCLGMAAGLVECLMPRDMWKMMPGGMPYYVVKEVADEPETVS